MKQYTVTGMSCAACSARVEKAVSHVAGVESCSVSLLTNSMGVEGDVKDADIIAAVEQAGYGAEVKGTAYRSGKSGRKKREHGRRRDVKRQGNSGFEEKTDRIRLLFGTTYVSFYGTYDVGLAGARSSERKPCGDGADPASAHRGRDDHQSEILYRRFPEFVASGAEYGYTCRAGRRGIVRIQRLCTVCDDGCTDADGYGWGHGFYA